MLLGCDHSVAPFLVELGKPTIEPDDLRQRYRKTISFGPWARSRRHSAASPVHMECWVLLVPGANAGNSHRAVSLVRLWNSRVDLVDAWDRVLTIEPGNRAANSTTARIRWASDAAN